MKLSAAVQYFNKAQGLAILWAHLSEAPAPFDTNLGIPGWLEKIVLQCLEKDPNKRFKTANDLCAELMLGN
jgi:serine/threonine protein kinase